MYDFTWLRQSDRFSESLDLDMRSIVTESKCIKLEQLKPKSYH